LGLKGSLNEYELDLLRQRSVEARREKARRRKPKEHWLALIPNSHEGYVSWEQHQRPVVLFAQRHPFTADDAATLRHAQAVAVSPDGKTILYKIVFGG